MQTRIAPHDPDMLQKHIQELMKEGTELQQGPNKLLEPCGNRPFAGHVLRFGGLLSLHSTAFGKRTAYGIIYFVLLYIFYYLFFFVLSVIDNMLPPTIRRHGLTRAQGRVKPAQSRTLTSGKQPRLAL